MKQAKSESKTMRPQGQPVREYYLTEAANHVRLSEKEEKELFENIAKGDDKALEKLIESSLWHVINIAKQYDHSVLPLEDIINEGTIGLLRASRQFDVSRGIRFHTFATIWIKSAIDKALGSSSGVNQNISDSVSGNIEKFKDSSSNSLDEDSIKEIIKKEVVDYIDILDERSRKVIELIYGIEHYPMTMAEVGEEMGLKRERVRQIRNKALRKLSKVSKGVYLKSLK